MYRCYQLSSNMKKLSESVFDKLISTNGLFALSYRCLDFSFYYKFLFLDFVDELARENKGRCSMIKIYLRVVPSVPVSKSH